MLFRCHNSRFFILLSIILFAFLLSFSAQAGMFGADKPKAKELKNAFKVFLRGPVDLNDFEVEVLDNLGSKVEPNWGSRFEAVLEIQEPLYIEDGRESDITFVTMKTPENTKVSVYGKIYSTIYQGKWNHDIDIDGNPFSGLGDPINEFKGKVMVRGTQEEKDHFAAIKRAEEELRANIANAKSIIVGTWHDDNAILTYKDDQTYHIKWDNGRNVGMEQEGEWEIDGETLSYFPKEIKGKNDGQWAPYSPAGETIRSRIVYIDKDNDTRKDSGTWNAVRIK